MGKWMNSWTPQSRIVMIYVVVASAWIFLSDALLYALFGLAMDMLPLLSIIKGLLFIIITASLLYILLTREFNLRTQKEIDLQRQIEYTQSYQAQLRESESRFRKAIEEAPLPIMLFDDAGDVLAVSQTWLAITGYQLEQVKTIASWVELAYGERQSEVMPVIEQLFELQSRYDEGEFTINCADGSQRVWQFSSTPLGRLPNQRRLVMSIAADVTERIEAEMQVKRLNQALLMSNQTLEKRVEERTQQLEALIAELQASEKLKDNFVSMVNHELRTPISAITLSANMLKTYYDRFDEENRLNKINQIIRHTDVLTELVESILDVSRLDDKNYLVPQIEITPFDAIKQILPDVTVLAEAKQQQLEIIQTEKTTHYLLMNEEDLGHIWRNLITNAIKYTPSEGKITIRLGYAVVTDGAVTFDSVKPIRLPETLTEGRYFIGQVEDAGYGIPEVDLPHIFERFYRGWAKSSDIRGTGLGLSLVQALLKRHGGDVLVDSEIGQGSCFSFYILCYMT